MRQRVLYSIAIFLLAHLCVAQQGVYSLFKTEAPCVPASAQLLVSDTATYEIVWSNGNLGTNSGPLPSGRYTVTVNYVHKRDTSFSFELKIPPCTIIVKEYFSPNSDGYNDVWQISRLEYYPEFSLSVYDRNGQLVFKQEDKYEGWDGTGFLGLPVEDSTYFYVLFPDKKNKNNIISGKVMVIR
jgi:gliding motility-associated-like protein